MGAGKTSLAFIYDMATDRSIGLGSRPQTENKSSYFYLFINFLRL